MRVPWYSAIAWMGLTLFSTQAHSQDARKSFPRSTASQTPIAQTSASIVSLGRPVASIGKPRRIPRAHSPYSQSSMPTVHSNVAPVATTIDPVAIGQGVKPVASTSNEAASEKTSLFATASAFGDGSKSPVTIRSQSLPGYSEESDAPPLRTAPSPYNPVIAPNNPVVAPNAQGPFLPPEAGIDAYLPTAGVGDAPVQRWYASVEALLWTVEEEDNVPPLASTSDPADFGFIGNPSTQVLFSGPLDRNLQTGGRFTLGRWLTQEQTVGIETTWFFLGERSDTFFAGSNQFPVLARPFFRVDTGQEFAQLVAFPGIGAGTLSIDAPSYLWGGEVNMRCELCSPRFSRLDAIGGFRFLNFSEGLFITENIVALTANGDALPQATIVVKDNFQTHNQFYGGQVGLSADMDFGRWSLNLLGKVGIGVTHQTAKISGSQTIFNPNSNVITQQGGLLALSTNSGVFTQNEFTVVPEIGVTLGYKLSESIRLTAGYSFLYWSSVLRPAGTIDRTLDANLIPNFLANPAPTGINRPAPVLNDTGVWIQGLRLGMELRF